MWCSFQIWSHDRLSLEPGMREMFRNCCKNVTQLYVWQVSSPYHGVFWVSPWKILSMPSSLFFFFVKLILIYVVFVFILSIATLAVSQNMQELYRLVLVDTPLAPYFSELFTLEVEIIIHAWITSYVSTFPLFYFCFCVLNIFQVHVSKLSK